jgi:hypothetical protein
MLSMHRINGRLIEISDHRLRNSKQKPEMSALKKRCIMCAREENTHIHTHTHIQLLNRSSERKSVVDPPSI